jgi:hypothetical protein
MGKSAAAIRKKNPVRIRLKKTVRQQKKQINRGAKVKTDTNGVRQGSGVIHVREVWDKRKSLSANYASIGLNDDMREQRVTGQTNGIAIGGSGVPTFKLTGLGAVPLDDFDSDEEVSPVLAATPIVAALENAAASVAEHNALIGPRMTAGERKFVESLLKKYGTKPGCYRRMSKDHKLNIYQDTAGVLRRKCERYVRVVGANLSEWA